MKELGQQLLTNRALMCAISAWFVAQVLKTLVFAVLERRVNWRRLVDTGGLPSAHSALVVGLTTGIGLNEGWHTTNFAISLVFALIVMYDAIGIRQEAGKHADLLNELLRIAVIRDVYQQREELKELLGHTPLEVIAGALIGVMMALFVSVAVGLPAPR
jgi:acid phosphatase family membrane protein YuiD